ncbi:WD40 repeat domain-containing protein [Streptomyces sp. NPDC003691]
MSDELLGDHPGAALVDSSGMRWAPGAVVEHRNRRPLTGHTDAVVAVATAVVAGRPVAVTGSHDRTVRVWDLATGEQIGEPLTGHTDAVAAVATVVVAGRPVAVTGSHDATVRVWDLITREPVGEPLTGHTNWVVALAATVVDGRPVAVTSSTDGTLRRWNLSTGAQLGDPMPGHKDLVGAVATAVVDGRTVAVTGSHDATVRVWDLDTGEQIGERIGRQIGDPLAGRDGEVSAVATAVLDGRAVAVTGGPEGTVRVRDLATGEPMGEPLPGPGDPVHAVATTVLDGRPVAVVAGDDGTVQLWDLATGRMLGRSLVGHGSEVRAVTAATVDDGLVAVTTGGGLVRVWELAAGRDAGSAPRPTGAAADADWESSLAQGFGVLLGRPLSDYDPDARYGAYYGGNFLDETESDRDPAWLSPDALSGKVPVVLESLLLHSELDLPELRFDARRSLFEIDPEGLPEAFAEDLDAAGLPSFRIIRGDELARLLDRHGLDLTDPDLPEDTWTVWQARIVSDGTLLGALRAATAIGQGPDSLVPYRDVNNGDLGTEAAAEALVAAVHHPGLRAHLRTFSEAESHDLDYQVYSTRNGDWSGWQGNAWKEAGVLVTQWLGAVDQYEVSVVQLGTALERE